MATEKKVLVVSWSFYPDQAIGAHRAGKLCKYLPLYEWQPMVLTVKEKHYQVTDPSLLTQLPSDTRIKRTACFSEAGVRTGVKKIIRLLSRLRGKGVANLSEITFKTKFARKLWLEIPEAGWWFLTALRAGVKMARECDVVWATSPVAGNLVVANLIACLAGKPLVIDIRDPWMIKSSGRYPTRLHNCVDGWLERWVFKSAGAVVAVTHRMAKMYGRKYPFLEGRLSVIYNGFDPEDFPASCTGQRSFGNGTEAKVIRIGYFGSIGAGREESLEYLLKCLSSLKSKGIEPKDYVRVFIRGPRMHLTEGLITRMGAQEYVEVGEVVPYHEAIDMMSQMDYLLLLNAANQTHALTGKLFEYIGAQKPILAVTLPGEIDDFINEHQIGFVLTPGKERSSENTITSLLEGDKTMFFQKNVSDLADKFTRQRTAEQIAEVLDRVAAR